MRVVDIRVTFNKTELGFCFSHRFRHSRALIASVLKKYVPFFRAIFLVGQSLTPDHMCPAPRPVVIIVLTHCNCVVVHEKR